MTPSPLQSKIIADRSSWIRRMLANVRSLPLESYSTFAAEPRNAAAAESYLRRALEALLDLGRHILAKGFAEPVSEYQEVARRLVQVGVLDEQRGALLRQLAGFRNRLVHFYQEVSDRELHEICTSQLDDPEEILKAILDWIKAHPEKLDQQL